MARREHIILAMKVALALTVFSWVEPARAVSPESRVKAAYIYKLAAFVKWPEAPAGGRFRFCVVGNNEIAQVLSELARGERIGGAQASVERIDRDAVAQARSCQIVFTGQKDPGRAIIAGVSGRPVLTVADRSGGSSGGVIDFVVRDGKVRFVIDRAGARRQQLELSSKLLDIALAVR